jgi:gamma-glutamyltranspeptidase/glutathione hydrolase
MDGPPTDSALPTTEPPAVPTTASPTSAPPTSAPPTTAPPTTAPSTTAPPAGDLRSRHSRQLHGSLGAVAAAHPLAVGAGLEMLARGGSAVDAALAAQAVICVAMPHSAGLGGDLLALIREPGGEVIAVNGSGCSAATPPDARPGAGSAVTVPGLVDAWAVCHERWGRLSLGDVLRPATRLARDGIVIDPDLRAAVDAQRGRLVAGGAHDWPLLAADLGSLWQQPALADLLDRIADTGAPAFYRGVAADAVARAVEQHGGTLSADDLAVHRTVVTAPVAVDWDGGSVCVQPPASQGVLLAMALRHLEAGDSDITNAAMDPDSLDHLLIELTEAVFEFRSSCGRGPDLLDERLRVDPALASRRGGPRAYLHTAGVATADRDGMVVSSLVSVFDDFGSGVFVPELGLTLNNRAAGFTDGDNSPAPAKRPVHTLAPAMVLRPDGDVLAVATPGADGQIQTLLQILGATRYRGRDLTGAIAAPRWRSEGGAVRIESDHPAAAGLTRRGHRVVPADPGDELFGAVVVAGVSGTGPFAAADWRRFVWSGAA